MSQRDYICNRCFLLYGGTFETIRMACPNCGNPSPHATDTFSSSYFERDMVRFFGPDVFERLYWSDPANPLHFGKTPKRTQPAAVIPSYEDASNALFQSSDCTTTKAWYDALRAEWDKRPWSLANGQPPAATYKEFLG